MKNILFTLVMLFSTSTIQAASLSPTHLPKDLLFLKKPIDAYCFSNLENSINTIQLKNCGAAQAKLTIKNEKNNYLIQKNFIGYDWIDKSNQGNGFTYYQAFPAGQNKFWIYTLNNGGGTGNFTSVYLYSRINSNIANIKTAVNGGDRCNGGIEKVESKNSKLHYAISLTAFDILTMIKENPKVKAYDDIAACASCCFAKAVYEMDTTLTPVFQYVDFGTNQNALEMPDQGTHQKCFNTLFASYVAKGKNKLTKAALTEFVAEFESQCIVSQ